MGDTIDSQIQQFYADQTILITGGTGFLGKLLIEKLLRSTDCRTIFVLVRERNGQTAQDRLNRLFDDVVFDRLKRERCDFTKRITAIRGDSILENFGLQQEDEEILVRNVNIVFHVAATVRFNEDLKRAYLINVRATRDLIKLCKRMQQLKSIAHVSTAYSHCYRKDIDECFYDLPYDFNEITKLIETQQQKTIEQTTKQIIGKWPNTYTFTKALAEDVIRHETNLPIGIYRPAIVISTYKEPIPGWGDSLYGPNGIVASVLSGLTRVFPIDDDRVPDVIPADYCIAGLITVAWDIAKQNRSDRTPPIYNYVSSPENPINWDEFSSLSHLQVAKYPSEKMLWLPVYITVTNPYLYRFLDIVLHLIPGCLFDIFSMLLLKKPKVLRTYQFVKRVTDVLTDFSLYDWHFSNTNMKRLVKQMNDCDREVFVCNIAQLSWLIYFRSYIRGIRMYLLDDDLDTLNKAKTKLWWLNQAHYLLKFIFHIFLFLIIYFIFTKIF